jgi:lipoprotein-anchoring transpeptidase ErfK/SrfK
VVEKADAPRLKVLLPVRPNGSTGWIRESAVSTFRHDFRITIELGLHRITVYRGSDVFLQEPIGVGTKDTPTPGGLYYIKELLRPPEPNTVYGPYAYGLSGFSDVLAKFAGGEGVIGIHGNNDPTSLGKDVSHGCIRMSNAGIIKLANTLSLGVPVEIRA